MFAFSNHRICLLRDGCLNRCPHLPVYLRYADKSCCLPANSVSERSPASFATFEMNSESEGLFSDMERLFPLTMLRELSLVAVTVLDLLFGGHL